jgi:hypothetical protein
VSVAFHTASLGEHVTIRADPGIHHPQLQTTDFGEQEPMLRQALQEWWVAKPSKKLQLSDDAEVQELLQEAARVYGTVSGWTKGPGPHKKCVLKGHTKLLRELDALYAGRRLVQQALDRCTSEGMAGFEESGMKMWQRATLRHQVLKHVLPPAQQRRSGEFWGAVLDTVRKEVKQRQMQVRVETEKDRKEQLQRALARVRGDFGRRRRTFKAALLKNPPSIPLWGVLTSHPDTVSFATWTVEEVVEKCQKLQGSFMVEDGA